MQDFKCGNCEFKDLQVENYPCSECSVLKNGDSSNFTPTRKKIVKNSLYGRFGKNG